MRGLVGAAAAGQLAAIVNRVEAKTRKTRRHHKDNHRTNGARQQDSEKRKADCKALDKPCKKNSQCCSNYCDIYNPSVGNVCLPKPDGMACASNEECQSALCK